MAYRDLPELDHGSLRREDRLSAPHWRIIAAFVFAPLIAAFAFCVVFPAYAGLSDYWTRVFRTLPLVAVFGAYLPTLLFGIPAYLIAVRHLRPSALSCVVVGAVVASIPWTLLGLTARPDAAYTNGRATVVDGTMTAYGWLEFGQTILTISLFGALGGLAFWVLAIAGALPDKVID